MTPEQLIETILKPLGTELRHYMPKFREEALEAAARAIHEINKEPLIALNEVIGWAINSQIPCTEESWGYFDESDAYKKALAVIEKTKGVYHE